MQLKERTPVRFHKSSQSNLEKMIWTGKFASTGRGGYRDVIDRAVKFKYLISFYVAFIDITIFEVPYGEELSPEILYNHTNFEKIMAFSKKSPTYQAASFAATVIEKSAPIGMSKGKLDSLTAIKFSSVGMHLEGHEIRCSACEFTSSLLLDTHEILGKHFTLKKDCPNNLKISHSVLKKMLLQNIVDWSSLGFEIAAPSNVEIAEVPQNMESASNAEELSEAETLLPFDFEEIPKDEMQRRRLADFKSVNSDSLVMTSDSLSDDDSKDGLPGKMGFLGNEDGVWTCVSCKWASPSYSLEAFVKQHGLFSPNCSCFETKADFQTKGIIATTSYRPLQKRVFSEKTSLGNVLCYLKLPVLERGLEFLHLFLFWDVLTISRRSEKFLQEVYRVVEKMEQFVEAKFIVPLRNEDSPIRTNRETECVSAHSRWLGSPQVSNEAISSDWVAMMRNRDSYINSLTCGLCFESSDLYINLECGHVMLCFECILKLPQSQKTCPICRTRLNAVQPFRLC